MHNDRTVTLRAGLCALFLLCACSDVTTNLVDERSGAVDATDSGARGDAHAPGATDSGNMSRPTALCNGTPCRCDNGKDDDGDGLVDGLDPECTGPYDNDESSFATGAPVSAR